MMAIDFLVPDHELERLADVLTIFTLSASCLQFCYNCLWNNYLLIEFLQQIKETKSM